MPFRGGNVPTYKAAKDIEVKYESFNGGWNNLFKPTELKPNELAQADNLMLIGQGTPTGRWGSTPYHLAGEVGRVRLLDAYYNSLTSTNLLLTITDSGYLVKKSDASYTIITGASFPSGSNYFGTQLGNNFYINGPSINFLKFDGSNLIPYVALSVPTNVSLAQLSAASGFNTYNWLITATSLTGETIGSVAKSLTSLPLDLTQTSVRVSWNTVSATASTLTGYNIYRGFPGDETYIASVGPSATQFIDTGTPQADTIFPPLADTTGGPRARFRLKFDDRIVLAGLDGDPSRVLISARYPNHDRFSAIDGGGYILVSPNDGDDITGLGIAGNQGMAVSGSSLPASAILVYKRNSTYRVTLSITQLGNYNILDPQAQFLSNTGASSADTIKAVENDTYSFGVKGLNSTGQEPNFLNQIRTNEISARIRPYVQSLSDSDFKEATAAYIDFKYLLSFPIRRETIVYDHERLCFMGPWKTPFGITKWLKYFDPSGQETWLAGTDTVPYVQQFSSSYSSDNGTAIAKSLRTKKEDMGNWSIFKVLKLFYVLFRNIRGSVTINLRIEDRTGNTVTTKSFAITSALGNGGWGGDQWGTQEWGLSTATVVLTGDELVRYSNIYKNCRVVQIEILTSGANDNFEFLATRMTANSLGDQSLPSPDRV